MKFILSVIYTLYCTLVMIIILISFIPLGWLYSLWYKDKTVGWYRVGWLTLTLIRKLIFIRVYSVGEDQIPMNAVIFAANHEGTFDGVFFNFIREKQLVALTAPLKYFPVLFSFWLKKSGCIDVARDFNEEAIYRDSNRRNKVYSLLNEALQAQKDVLIFPEGHIEHEPTLQPFHWGAVKLGLLSGKPIVPTTIHGTRRFFPPHKKRFSPGVITITFHKPFSFSDANRAKYTLDKVTNLTLDLEREIAQSLPRSMVPPRLVMYTPPDSKKVTAFFDVDRTLFPNYTEVIMAKALLKAGLLPVSLMPKVIWWYFLEAAGELDHRHIVPNTAHFLKGWSKHEVEAFAQMIFDKKIKRTIYKEAENIIKSHQDHGHKVVLISEAFEPFVKPIAHYLKVDDLYATPLEEKNGHLTGRLAGPLAYGQGKKNYAETYLKKHGLSFNETFAYGDSFGDSVLLRSVKYPYAVNPKPRLLRIAHQHQMPVLSFSHSDR